MCYLIWRWVQTTLLLIEKNLDIKFNAHDTFTLGAEFILTELNVLVCSN